MAPPVSAATRGPTSSITNRVPKGTTLGSTETVSRELDLPEAVIPLPVWQLTSKTPSSAPPTPSVLVGARAGAGRVVAGGAAGGGFAAVQAPRRTPPATAPSSATAGPHRQRRCRARIGMSWSCAAVSGADSLASQNQVQTMASTVGKARSSSFASQAKHCERPLTSRFVVSCCPLLSQVPPVRGPAAAHRLVERQLSQ